jgi:hypothetical protein
MKTKLFCLVGVCCALGATMASAVEIQARCTAEYGGKTAHVNVRPTRDVFSMTTSDALSPFRFSAQYLAESGKLKTYVYHDAKERYVLIHAAEYALTQANCSQHLNNFGLHKIYSARMEKELFLQCVAVCE